MKQIAIHACHECPHFSHWEDLVLEAEKMQCFAPKGPDLDALDDFNPRTQVAPRCPLDDAPVVLEDRLRDMVDKLIQVGGSIVATNELGPIEIASAAACRRMAVTKDGCGYVYFPPRRPEGSRD